MLISYFRAILSDMPIIKLQSSDGEIFEAEVKTVKCFGTIKTMLEECGIDENVDTAVPLPNVSSAILRLVLQWADFHKDDPAPPNIEENENKEKCTDDICSWDADFLKVEQSTVFELLMAANYLHNEALIELTCKTIANMIKGKTTEEIRITFGIKNDFPGTVEKKACNFNFL